MSTVTANLPLNIFRPKEALLSMFSNDIRPDGRKLNEIRQFEVTKLPVAKKLELDNFQSNSWVLSSVQVRFGQTLILGVVSGSIRYPKVEGDNCGDFDCTVAINHLFPIGSFSRSELVDNKPPIAVDIEQFIKETLIKGKLINLRELCLLEDEYLLSLKVNLTVLSNDGNLRDCAFYATLAALHEVVLPEASPKPIESPTKPKGKKSSNNKQPSHQSVSTKDLILNYDKNRKLSLSLAIPLTFGIFNNNDKVSAVPPVQYVFYDPLEKETQFADGSLTIVYQPITDTIHLISMNSNGINRLKLLELIALQKERILSLHKYFVSVVESS